jgi:hypothetical protein
MWSLTFPTHQIALETRAIPRAAALGSRKDVFYFPEGGVGLVPKRGCLLSLSYYAFPI